MSKLVEGVEYAACPFCKQYSHSIRGDVLGAAIRHFESMYTHPLRGTPMGHHFDEQTRNYAHVLVAAASVDRSPEGGDHEDGRHAKHESAVANGETPTPGMPTIDQDGGEACPMCCGPVDGDGMTLAAAAQPGESS